MKGLTKAQRAALEVLSETAVWGGVLWASRRRRVLHSLADGGLAKHSYQSLMWSITDAGRRALSTDKQDGK